MIVRDTAMANVTRSNKKQFLSKKELSEYLGISVFTIDSWVSGRREIPFVKMGKRVMFDMLDVANWVTSRKVHPKEVSDRLPT